MRRLGRFSACLALLLLLLAKGYCAPELAFPINSQVPPVAYASKPYSYRFSANTFQSTQSQISYRTSDGPSWLSLDPSQHTIVGTPSPADVGTSTFELIATDGLGFTSTTVTLVVLERQGITAGISIESSLKNAGTVVGPTTLVLQPLVSFSIPFEADIFAGTSTTTSFYALCDNQSPLPPWIKFDGPSLTLSGTAPPLASSNDVHQTYHLDIIASNVPGFSQASASFDIVISMHVLSFESSALDFIVSRGQNYKSPSFLDGLLLDGTSIANQDLQSAMVEKPDWITFDDTSMTLQGDVPTSFDRATITLIAKDRFDGTATLTINLEAEREVSTQTLTPTITTFSMETTQTSTGFISATATIGQIFDYTIERGAVDDTTQVSANLVNASSWLLFYPKNATLYGEVPEGTDPQIVVVSIIFINGKHQNTRKLLLDLVDSKVEIGSTNAATLISTSDTQPTTDAGTRGENTLSPSAPRHIILIASVGGGLILSIIALILLLLCLRKRKAKQKESNVNPPEEESSRKGKEPATTSDDPTWSDGGYRPVSQAVTTHTSDPQATNKTPEKVPQVELMWAPDSLQKARDRLSKRLKQKHHESFDSSWGDLVKLPGPDLTAAEAPSIVKDMLIPLQAPPLIPNYSHKRGQSSHGGRIAKRPTRSPSNLRKSRILTDVTNRQSGLPERSSYAGIGHGAGVLRAPSPDKRSSWQTTAASFSLGGTRPSISTTANLDLFPIPPSSPRDDKENMPSQGQTFASLAGYSTKPSLRLVEPSSSDPPESFELQRQRWHTERARSRLEGFPSRFSNAGSSLRDTSILRPIHKSSPAGSPTRRSNPSSKKRHDTFNSRSSQSPHRWSKWSGLGPAARAESPLPLQTRGYPAIAPTAFSRQIPPTRHGLPRERENSVATASSGRFDSALSSDSQWEDEGRTDLMLGVDETGEKQWHTGNVGGSPRLPFEAVTAGEASSVKGGGAEPVVKVADRRNRVVSVGITEEREADGKATEHVEVGKRKRDWGWGGREKSQKGSLRFV